MKKDVWKKLVVVVTILITSLIIFQVSAYADEAPYNRVYKVITQGKDYTGGSATVYFPKNVSIGKDKDGNVDYPLIYLGLTGNMEVAECGFEYIKGEWIPIMGCWFGPVYSAETLKKAGLKPNQNPNFYWKNCPAYTGSSADISVRINGTTTVKQTFIDEKGKITKKNAVLPKVEFLINGKVVSQCGAYGLIPKNGYYTAAVKRLNTVVGYTLKAKYDTMKWRNCCLSKDKSLSSWFKWDKSIKTNEDTSKNNGAFIPTWINKYYDVDIKLRS